MGEKLKILWKQFYLNTSVQFISRLGNRQRPGNQTHTNCLTERWLSVCGCRTRENWKRLRCYQCRHSAPIIFSMFMFLGSPAFFSDSIAISHSVLSRHMLLPALSHFPRTLEKLKIYSLVWEVRNAQKYLSHKEEGDKYHRRGTDQRREGNEIACSCEIWGMSFFFLNKDLESRYYRCTTMMGKRQSEIVLVNTACKRSEWRPAKEEDQKREYGSWSL